MANCPRCGYSVTREHPAGADGLHSEADCSALLAKMRSTSGMVRDQLAECRPDPAGPPPDPLEQIDRYGVPFEER